ncbi:MAG: ABC transporter permease [Nocardioidaceae bacterium]
MTAFISLSKAIFKGFLRDRQSVFFSVFFPLMFLVLFGGIFSDSGASKVDVVLVGDVSLIDDLDQQGRAAFEDAFAITHADDFDAAVQQVRDGDVTLAVMQQGNDLTVRYSEADQVKSAVAQGTLQSFVQAANVASTGRPATYDVQAQRVEDKSLRTIQFVTPGLLGWAVATSATFGAAATLTGWRTSKLLRRLRLAPVRAVTVVGARIAVTVVIALAQMAIFVGLAVAAFGLRLSGAWYMAVPLLVCGTLCFMALGLLAGAVSKTVEGASSLSNIFVLPMAFLSGSFFPLDGAPRWLDVVSHLLPLRHLNDAMLDVMVRGQGPGSTVVPMLILLAFAAAVLLVASRFFSWETD